MDAQKAIEMLEEILNWIEDEDTCTPNTSQSITMIYFAAKIIVHESDL